MDIFFVDKTNAAFPAVAIAVRASVTVSIAAESIGIYSRRIVFVNCVLETAVFRKTVGVMGNKEDVVKRQGFFSDT